MKISIVRQEDRARAPGIILLHENLAILGPELRSVQRPRFAQREEHRADEHEPRERARGKRRRRRRWCGRGGREAGHVRWIKWPSNDRVSRRNPAMITA